MGHTHAYAPMRTVSVTTTLDAPADVVWTALGSPAAFVHVARGMLRFPAAERHGRRWSVGDEVRGWTWLFGVIPWSRHRLAVVEIDHAAHRFRSDESGGAVRAWRHLIEVDPLDGDRCVYRDEIEIEAGALTRPVAWFAHVFYRYRQRRWRAVAPLLAATTSPRREPPT